MSPHWNENSIETEVPDHYLAESRGSVRQMVKESLDTETYRSAGSGLYLLTRREGSVVASSSSSKRVVVSSI